MGENWSFWRRSWRRHPALSAAQAGCGLGVAITGLVRLIGGHSPWSTALVLAFMVGAFVCWVMLVRRDEG